jgi:hypothetical protein
MTTLRTPADCAQWGKGHGLPETHCVVAAKDLKVFQESIQGWHGEALAWRAAARDANASDSPAELLRKVKAAQYVESHPGEVCPAKWQEGEKTLAPSLDLVGKI